jgi:hypothetical protein
MLESDAPLPQQANGDAHVVGEPREIPHVVGDGLLANLLDISADTYARRKKRGDFAFLLLRPQPAGRTQYSGALVARWLGGEDLTAIGGSRYFARGRTAGQHGKRRTGAGRPKGRSNQAVAVVTHHAPQNAARAERAATQTHRANPQAKVASGAAR